MHVVKWARSLCSTAWSGCAASPWGLASIHAGSPKRQISSHALASAFQQKITSRVCNGLAANGFAVVDNLFEPSISTVLREEVTALHKAGLMHPNSTHLVKDSATQLLQKHNVYEAELTFDESIQAKAPVCAQLNADRALAVMLSLFLPQLTLDAQAIKLQVNTGSGGCFPCHFDTDEMLDGRKVTCIFYLNPGWKEADGGVLRLYPFPHCAPVDIQPVHNRLVIFSSARMLHRVLPSSAAERVCFTIWLSQTRRTHQRPAQSLSALSAKAREQPDGAYSLLLQPQVRKHLLKLVYADEWAKSIEESHPPGSECSEAVSQHWKEVDIIRKALGGHEAAISALCSSVCPAGSSDGHTSNGARQADVHKVAWF